MRRIVCAAIRAQAEALEEAARQLWASESIDIQTYMQKVQYYLKTTAVNLRAQADATIEAGYVLVPCEPTTEMSDFRTTGVHWPLGERIYKAMLAAAPKRQLFISDDQTLKKAQADLLSVLNQDVCELQKFKAWALVEEWDLTESEGEFLNEQTYFAWIGWLERSKESA